MTGLPTIAVKLDDGTGTYPIDLTSVTRLPDSISVSSFGRGDEFSQPQPTALSFSLDNASGAVTGGSTTSLITGDASTFEAGISTWAGVGGASVAQSATHVYQGSNALRITWPTAASGVGRGSFVATGLTVGSNYTLVASSYVATGAPNVRLITGTGAQGPIVTTKDAYVRTSVTFVATATSTNVQLQTAASSTAGQFAWLDTVVLYPGYGFVLPEQPIRFTETLESTTRDRFTGRISALDLGWPGGGQSFATVKVTAADVFADLSRRPMRSMLEEEILLNSPSAYYTLGEAEGSTSAGDTSGNGAAALTIAGTGAALTFGNGTGPVDSLSATTFAGGESLSDNGIAAVTVPTTYSMGCIFSTTSALGSLIQGQGDLGWELSINGSGEVRVFVPGTGSGLITGPVVTDGLVHTVLATGDGATATLYVDGVSAGTRAIGAPNSAIQELNVGVGFIGTISHVALFDTTVSAGGAATISQVAHGLSEATDARLSRLASYAGLTSTSTSPSGQIMGPQATSGQSLYEAMQAVAQAEGGVLFADGSGDITMQGRYFRGLRTTADLTLGETEPGPDTAVTWDTQQKINQVTVTRTGGATQVYPTLAAGTLVYPQSLDIAVDTDDSALSAAEWLVSKHTETAPRLGSVTFDLMTSASAEAILDLTLGERLDLSAMPSQLWAGLGDYTIEGWTESLSDTAWTLAVNLLPFDLAEVAVWDDAASLWDSAVWGY